MRLRANTRAGQVTSPIAQPSAMTCARTWLSKTKSSEFVSSGSRSSNCARKGAITGVILRKLRAEEKILHEREEPV